MTTLRGPDAHTHADRQTRVVRIFSSRLTKCRETGFIFVSCGECEGERGGGKKGGQRRRVLTYVNGSRVCIYASILVMPTFNSPGIFRSWTKCGQRIGLSWLFVRILWIVRVCWMRRCLCKNNALMVYGRLFQRRGAIEVDEASSICQNRVRHPLEFSFL